MGRRVVKKNTLQDADDDQDDDDDDDAADADDAIVFVCNWTYVHLFLFICRHTAGWWFYVPDTL